MSDNKELFTNPDSFHAKLQALAPEPSEAPTIKEEHHEEVVEETSAPESEEVNEAELVEPVNSEETEASSGNDSDDYKNRKFIPKSRFNQEIEKRKVLEEQLMKEREDRIRFEEQAKMYSKFQDKENTANAPYKAPEMDLDSIDALDTETHQVYSREIKQLKEELRKTSQQTKQVQYSNAVASQESAFSKDNPDYMKAATYLRDIEFNGAKEMYGDDNQAQMVVLEKYQRIMTRALESGKNVPETIYKLAKTYGYKPDVVATEKKSGANLSKINENMKKSASISSLGNGLGMGNTSPKDINAARKDPSNPRSPFDPSKFKQLLQKVG